MSILYKYNLWNKLDTKLQFKHKSMLALLNWKWYKKARRRGC